MSKPEVVFDDPNARCNSYVHQNQRTMQVCVTKGCSQTPNYICLDCVRSIHPNHVLHTQLSKSEILNAEDFVRETNHSYKRIQDSSLKLEGHLAHFSQDLIRMKKMYSGEVERVRNQLQQYLDTMKEMFGIFCEQIEKSVRPFIQSQIKTIDKEIHIVKANRISHLQQRQLQQLIKTFWHSDFEKQLEHSGTTLSSWLGPFQKGIRTFMTNISNQMTDLFQSSKDQFEQKCRSASEQIMSTLKSHQNESKQQSASENDIQTLLKERDVMLKEMQNLGIQVNKPLIELKALYGYYYLQSNYAQYQQLPINKMGKCRRINDRMHNLVIRLYETGYRDNEEKDYILSHFIS